MLYSANIKTLPFSQKKAEWAEQPGPPTSQSRRGSFKGLL